MRRALALVALLAAVPAAAVDPGETAAQPMAQMMRKLWASQQVDAVATVQRVWTRTVGFDLPRPFVPAYRAQSGGSFIMEYVPDGETVQAWTRMITISGSLGAGAARIDDTTLASALFNRRACTDWRYRDLGATRQPVLPYRTLVIGCGADGAADSERGAMAFFRDAENSWTVQYAVRGAATRGFEAGAAARIARLKPLLTCRTDKKDC